MMNITLLNATDGGGAGVAALRLFHALRKHEQHPKVLLQKAKKAEVLENPAIQTWVNSPIRKGQYALRHFREQQMVGGGNWQNFSTGFYGVPVSHHPWVREADVLHMHWINDNFIAVKELARLKKPIVWTLHDMWPYTGGFHYVEDEIGIAMLQRDDVQDARSKLFAKVWLQKAEIFPDLDLHIVTPSHWLADLASRAPLFSGKPVHCIPNPIDTHVYVPAKTGEQSEAKTKFGIAPEEKVVLFGSFNVLHDERKGFRLLKEALQELWAMVGDRQPIRLAVIGKRNDELVKEVPFPVTFLGFFNSDAEMVKAYQVADVFVLPSQQDNLPNMCLEALACGVPAVAFNIGGVPDMVLEGKTGLLSELGDTKTMAQNLQKVLSDEELRESYSQAARAHVVERFSEKKVADQMIGLYQSLIE